MYHTKFQCNSPSRKDSHQSASGDEIEWSFVFFARLDKYESIVFAEFMAMRQHKIHIARMDQWVNNYGITPSVTLMYLWRMGNGVHCPGCWSLINAWERSWTAATRRSACCGDILARWISSKRAIRYYLRLHEVRNLSLTINGDERLCLWPSKWGWEKLAFAACAPAYETKWLLGQAIHVS